MPDKHFYFSIGSSLGAVASYYVIGGKAELESRFQLLKRLKRKRIDWTLYFPLIIFLVGLWGLIPDILHALNILPKEITRGPLFDLFFFHSTFESLEDTNASLDRLLNWLGGNLVDYRSRGDALLRQVCKKSSC